MRIPTVLVALMFSLAPASAEVAAAPDSQSDLRALVDKYLAEGPAGTRYGLLVTTMEGEPIVSVLPDQRFIPASNTKMFTTVTAYSMLPMLDRSAKGTGVRLEKMEDGRINVVLHGFGDARLSSADGCVTDCLQTLADAVAAKTRHVHNVVGDDSWFPDERWGPGMSWNNIESKYGTGISALTLDDNELAATVTPATVGAAAVVAMPAYYTVENRVMTVPGKGRSISSQRMPNSSVILLTGTIGAEAEPATLSFGIDDPAHYAAWRLRTLLEGRGVRVSGGIETRHRALSPADDPAVRKGAPAARPPLPEMLAQLPALPLAEDIRTINKVSQNLHADLMLRRVAQQTGSGSIADGQAVLHGVMEKAGLAPQSYAFSDGSGMSTYNRLSPRGAVALLTWVAKQPWSADWRATLPVAGQDGTLRARFHGTLLDGKLFAKTGSLNASRALSGYFITKSGKTLIFSALANDIPEGGDNAASAAVDHALIAIAEAH